MGIKSLKCLHWRPRNLKDRVIRRCHEQEVENDGASQVSRRKPVNLVYPYLNISCTSLQHWSAVSSSILFQRLPLELRELVYSFVLGSKVIHLVNIQVPYPAKSYTQHVYTEYRTLVTQSTVRRPLRICCEPDPRSDPLQFNTVDLRLLQSCRQIYMEAIKVFYCTVVFDIENFSVLIRLDDMYWPAHRISMIRHLSVYGRYRNGDYPAWVRFWEIVTTRMRLRSLRITICMHRWEMDDHLLAPTRGVKGIPEVEIKLFCSENGTQTKAAEVAEEMALQMRGKFSSSS